MTILRIRNSKLASLALAMAICILSPARVHGAVEHAGYRIAPGNAVTDGDGKLPAAIRDSGLRQLKMIDELKLPAPVTAVFQSFEMTFDATLQGQPGAFVVRNGVGLVRLRPMNTTLPVVLHELLHGYQFKVLGPDHPEIIAAYRRAMNTNNLQRFRSSHFLMNPKEFFATTASIHLLGEIRQPPFGCEALWANQEYLVFLISHFGAGKCSTPRSMPAAHYRS